MMKLYYAPPSIYGCKVLAVLMEKNVDYEIVPMSFAAGDHKKPEYLKLNPNGEIPTLDDDGQIIYESTAIIEYLDEEYPEPPLMPADSFERAKVRMIEEYCDLHLYPALAHCLIKEKFKNETLTEADKATVAKGVQRIEAYLGKQKFLVKDFSLADCCFMAAILPLETFGFTDLITASPSLNAYVTRLKARPSYKGASLVEVEA